MLYLDNAATSYQKPAVFYAAMRRYTESMSVNAGRGANALSIAGARGILNTAEELCLFLGLLIPSKLHFLKTPPFP